MPTYAYRYDVAFPRRWDEARAAGRIETIEALLAIPDVVDALFPDLTASWRSEEYPERPNRESRRRTIVVLTSSASKADADRAGAAIRELVASRKRDTSDRIAVTRTPIELWTV